MGGCGCHPTAHSFFGCQIPFSTKWKQWLGKFPIRFDEKDTHFKKNKSMHDLWGQPENIKNTLSHMHTFTTVSSVSEKTRSVRFPKGLLMAAKSLLFLRTLDCNFEDNIFLQNGTITELMKMTFSFSHDVILCLGPIPQKFCWNSSKIKFFQQFQWSESQTRSNM